VKPALRAIDLAIRVNPLARVAWSVSAWVRAMNGEYETPIAHWAKAEMCSPLGASADQTNAGRALCCWMAGRYQKALSWAKISLERVPNNPGSLTAGLAAAAMLNDVVQARTISRALLEFYPEGSTSSPTRSAQAVGSASSR
jgi:tetratricopeptide (TPR) repeat protein